jgi:hypothetical protein
MKSNVVMYCGQAGLSHLRSPDLDGGSHLEMAGSLRIPTRVILRQKNDQFNHQQAASAVAQHTFHDPDAIAAIFDLVF